LTSSELQVSSGIQSPNQQIQSTALYLKCCMSEERYGCSVTGSYFRIVAEIFFQDWMLMKIPPP